MLTIYHIEATPEPKGLLFPWPHYILEPIVVRYNTSKKQLNESFICPFSRSTWWTVVYLHTKYTGHQDNRDGMKWIKPLLEPGNGIMYHVCVDVILPQ